MRKVVNTQRATKNGPSVWKKYVWKVPHNPLPSLEGSPGMLVNCRDGDPSSSSLENLQREMETFTIAWIASALAWQCWEAFCYGLHMEKAERADRPEASLSGSRKRLL